MGHFAHARFALYALLRVFGNHADIHVPGLDKTPQRALRHN